jgi:hypothetical protein
MRKEIRSVKEEEKLKAKNIRPEDRNKITATCSYGLSVNAVSSVINRSIKRGQIDATAGDLIRGTLIDSIQEVQVVINLNGDQSDAYLQKSIQKAKDKVFEKLRKNIESALGLTVKVVL